jgi:hypothetical protein
MSQLDLINRQIAGAAKNAVNRELAGVRRETSVVGRANRLFASALRDFDKPKKTKAAKNGVYMGTGDLVDPAPDGYIRRSPVQAMAVAKDYKARIVKRIIAIVIGVFAVALALYALRDLLKL